MELTIVTSNTKKAEQIGFFLGIPVKTVTLDIDEIQSLNLLKVLEAKARSAYAELKVPLIVDDVSLDVDELKGLPGPLVRWFLDTVGPEGLCRLADQTQTRAATATVGIGYINANGFKAFTGSKRGKIADHPAGDGGFGWDSVFIQEGFELTRAALTPLEYEHASIRKIPLDALKSYLSSYTHAANTH